MVEAKEHDCPELTLLYEDESFVAVAKPSGMFVHRSDADHSATCFVLQSVRDQLNQMLFPVHRLDRATSGVVLLARSSNAAAAVGKLFTERLVSKTYFALVRGHCEDSGEINDPLVSARGRGLPSDHPHAQPQDALTRFKTVERYEMPVESERFPTTRCSLIEASPITGRYHQIRRHFNYFSHPVIGDTSHGDGRQNRSFRENFGVTRLMLASVRMNFQHPLSEGKVEISCPPETSFQTVIDRLKPWRLPVDETGDG